MTKAHDLFDALGLPIEKGQTTAHPAASAGPTPDMRYWATEIATQGEFQFGAQMRSRAARIPQALADRLQTWGFKLRPNGREIYRLLPTDIPEATADARLVIAVLQAAS